MSINTREFYFDEFLKNSFDGTPTSGDFVHVILGCDMNSEL